MPLDWQKTKEVPMPKGEKVIVYWASQKTCTVIEGHHKCTADYWARFNMPVEEKAVQK